jgi:hypothetical protein
MIDKAIKITKENKPNITTKIDKLRLKKFTEGRSAQIMHIGPYSKEGPTIEKVHKLIKERGFKFDGHEKKHHEIYISDPRRAKTENMKTIIRQPF